MSNSKPPIRRHTLLQPLSRDHHHALLLVWKIRKGVKTNVSPGRISAYVKWFYEKYINKHFILEEKCVVPVLGVDHEHVTVFLKEHDQLRALFEQKTQTAETLTSLANLLEAHIRFEERVLFNEVQEKASADQLSVIQAVHKDEPFVENEADIFWV